MSASFASRSLISEDSSDRRSPLANRFRLPATGFSLITDIRLPVTSLRLALTSGWLMRRLLRGARLLRGRLLWWWLCRIQNLVEVRMIRRSLPACRRMAWGHRTLRRRLTRSRVRHASCRLALNHDPLVSLLLHLVDKLHRRCVRIAILRSNIHVRLGRVAIYGCLRDNHVHVVHVQTLHRRDVLHHPGPDGILAVRFGFAGAGEKQQGTQQTCENCSIHSNFLSIPE